MSSLNAVPTWGQQVAEMLLLHKKYTKQLIASIPGVIY